MGASTGCKTSLAKAGPSLATSRVPKDLGNRFGGYIELRSN